jgi:hypothetical protein
VVCRRLVCGWPGAALRPCKTKLRGQPGGQPGGEVALPSRATGPEGKLGKMTTGSAQLSPHRRRLPAVQRSLLLVADIVLTAGGEGRVGWGRQGWGAAALPLGLCDSTHPQREWRWASPCLPPPLFPSLAHPSQRLRRGAIHMAGQFRCAASAPGTCFCLIRPSVSFAHLCVPCTHTHTQAAVPSLGAGGGG